MTRRPQLELVLKTPSIIGAIVGITVSLLGGAAVVQQALERNWDVVSTVAATSAWIAAGVGFYLVLLWWAARRARRIWIGLLEVLRLNGRSWSIDPLVGVAQGNALNQSD